MLKVHDGGWVPLALGGVLMAVMYTWRRGSRILFDKTRKSEVPLEIAGRVRWRRSRRCACRAPRCSSPAIRESRRPR